MNEPQQEVLVQDLQSQSSTEPAQSLNQTLSEDERKRVKLTEQMQQSQHFFVTIFKGLFKIIEEISSLLIRR